MDKLESFDIDVELPDGNFAIYIIPSTNRISPSSLEYLMVLDGVRVGTIAFDDTSWTEIEKSPWDRKDIQVIGYQIEKHRNLRA